ncbi:hypothetical protein BAUCODRAFT_330978 [Baudoinia panamericana UAMH 10762]|uniref:Uncharacterized protein n=1 Tax=Baudoinia panamericana (strain UAMH 10762) TaxID=717646 RepID=M2M2Y1_BAUPA|nr:uncharacterized protein BAUCODRAFT_330978 [Baudoinia panamericana UAMH 10762]EMC90891.1 hypothetical protein BAUCODRAFT_330978 [Baudoinia panamericana UAMH 10762]
MGRFGGEVPAWVKEVDGSVQSTLSDLALEARSFENNDRHRTRGLAIRLSRKCNRGRCAQHALGSALHAR